MSPDDNVQAELDLRRVRAVHTGGMTMDEQSPSYDTYEDPFVITNDGSKLQVSAKSARRVQRHLNAREFDDGFGYSAMG